MLIRPSPALFKRSVWKGMFFLLCVGCFLGPPGFEEIQSYGALEACTAGTSKPKSKDDIASPSLYHPGSPVANS